MKKDNITFATIITLCAFIYGLIIYWAFKDDQVCDTLVRFNDGTQMEAKNVHSYNNGMSSIELCTGEILRTPSLNIKTIEELKK